MANLLVKNGNGDANYLKGSGAGSDGDPFIGDHSNTDLIAPVGIVTEAAPGTDTASSGLNGRLQRIAQRITSLIALLPTAVGANGGLKVEGVASGVVVPISGTVTSTPLGSRSVAVQLTVTNGAYSIADVVGGLITFADAVSANGKHAIINSVKLGGVTALDYDLCFYSADIATPRLDNAVYGIAAADNAIFLGSIPIRSIDYIAGQTSFVQATIKGCGLEVKAGAATTSIYAYLVCRQTTTPGTTRLDLIVDFEYLD